MLHLLLLVPIPFQKRKQKLQETICKDATIAISFNVIEANRMLVSHSSTRLQQQIAFSCCSRQ